MTPGAWFRAGTAVVSAAVLLIAGCVHVAHVCRISAKPGQQAITELARDSDAPSRMLCLVCVGLHSPSLAAAPVSMVPGSAILAGAAVVSQPPFSTGLRGFALHVRPPPNA